jgi:3-hydroxyisobutyrate dehydrogenase-like beta-hydroxyacid dehydrogenase
MSDIGFIGLGIMGRQMAVHLITNGHKLFGRLPQPLLDQGGQACQSTQDVARQSEIIIIIVSCNRTEG